jgi:hypothetical protein
MQLIGEVQATFPDMVAPLFYMVPLGTYISIAFIYFSSSTLVASNSLKIISPYHTR